MGTPGPARRRRRSRTRSLVAAIGVAAAGLAAGAVGAGAQASSVCAQSSSQKACVILIQVDGLEAKDVTRENTPFLWGMAHPGLHEDGAGAQFISGDRAGFIWQAPRGSMTAGLASNTASLLTGGHPQQHGVPSDDFYRVQASDPDGNGGKPPTYPGRDATRFVLESDSDDIPDGAESLTANALSDGTQTLPLLVEENGGKAATIVADPDLGPLATDAIDSDELRWTPRPQTSENPEPQFAGHPALCDIPTNVGNGVIFDPIPDEGEQQSYRACAANDETTLRKAYDILSGPGADTSFAYIELAELGHIKRTTTDADDIQAAAASTDLELAKFFGRYAQPGTPTADKLTKTVVFIVGSGGYEEAPWKAPSPETSTGSTTADGMDLADWVNSSDVQEGKFQMLPQGSIATIYYKPESHAEGETAENPSAEHKRRVADLRRQLLEEGNQACVESLKGLTETDADNASCIAEVLYTRPQLAPADEKEHTVEKYESWKLDDTFFDVDRDTFEEIFVRSGSSGDLVVVMKRGWTTGSDGLTLGEMVSPEEGDGMTNPYPASYGGPRNRSIAAIINGPNSNGVRDLRASDNRTAQGQNTGGRFPVTKTAVGPPENPPCDDAGFKAEPATASVIEANRNPEDDANAPGHECQAEIADVGLTIAGLMGLPVRFQQIGGRLLYEAFDEGVLPPSIGERPSLQPPAAFLTAGPLVAAEGQKYPLNFDGLPIFGFVAQPDKGTITFECQLVSGEVAPAALPESGWSACGAPPSARPDLCKNTTDEDNDGEPDKDASGNLILVPFACSSHAISPKLANGIYTFSVRASNEAGTQGATDLSTAVFEVGGLYNCDQLVCGKLKAYVSDKKGKKAKRAKKGRLSFITLKAGFGEPFTAVDLTFYKDKSKSAKRKAKRLRRKARRASDPTTRKALKRKARRFERKAKRAKRRARRAARRKKGGKRGQQKLKLTAIADFQPFVLPLKQDAKAKLTFKVPRRYKPTHLGVDLEKLEKIKGKKARRRCKKKDTDPLCQYARVGECGKANTPTCVGDVLRVRQSQRLHKKAKGGGKKKGKGRKGKGKGRKGKRRARAGAARPGSPQAAAAASNTGESTTKSKRVPLE